MALAQRPEEASALIGNVQNNNSVRINSFLHYSSPLKGPTSSLKVQTRVIAEMVYLSAPVFKARLAAISLL